MDASLKERAYKFVRNKLAVGSFNPGRGLSDRTLAREMGVSRTPIREAIQQLQTEGFVVQVPGSGTYPRRLTEAELIELYELRELLEGHAAGRAAREMPDSEIAKLKQLCEESGKLVTDVESGKYSQNLRELADRANALEEQFHGAILGVAKSHVLNKIIRDLQLFERMEADWKYAPLDGFAKAAAHLRVFREHSAIADAIAIRSVATARSRMVKHIRNGRKHEVAHIVLNNSVQLLRETDGSEN